MIATAAAGVATLLVPPNAVNYTATSAPVAPVVPVAPFIIPPVPTPSGDGISPALDAALGTLADALAAEWKARHPTGAA